jgi:hypothetical protein
MQLWIELCILPESLRTKAPTRSVERGYLQLNSPNLAWKGLYQFQVFHESKATFSKPLNVPSINVRKSLNADEQCSRTK